MKFPVPVPVPVPVIDMDINDFLIVGIISFCVRVEKWSVGILSVGTPCHRDIIL